MAKFCEGTGNIIRHGDIEVSRIVVTIEIQATVQCAGTVNGEIVMGLDGVYEVLSVGFGEIFYSKVINAKDKHGAFGVVMP